MALSTGTRLGPYEILSTIGAGGMGEVYRARDSRLGRDVAVKVLPAAFSADPERLQRFAQEARAAAALNHPNILAVHDLGTHDGTPYIVTELLEGQSLREQLSDAGALRMRKALEYAIQVVRGLSAAHEKGIVHRDLKPENVFITTDGRVKILDFGLAKLTQPEPAVAAVSALPTTPPHTNPGLILGTLGYMSPEQVRGLAADHRADVFSFGAMLYEMLSGRRAFRGDTAIDAMTAILTAHPPDFQSERHIPPALARIVDRCLEKSPAARFQSADDLAFALEGLSSNAESGVSVPDVGSHRRPLPNIAWWGAALLLVIGSSIATAWYARRAPVEQVTTKLSVQPPPNAVISSDSAPVISPDGRTLAFVAREPSGRALLWIRPLDSLTAQPLTGTEGARQPFWSPDSRVLGFFAQGRLKRIDSSGGSPQTISDTGATLTDRATWGADGLILIGSTGVTPLQSVPAVGGQLKPATVLDASRQERSHNFPYFLPDGRHFLYVALSAKTENSGVYIGSTDSKDTKRLLGIRSEVRYALPGYLLFVREGALMAQPFDVGRLELSGDPFPIAEQVGSDAIFGNTMFSVSENGVLVYRAGGGKTQLTWFDRSGKVLGPVGSPGEYLNTELSPDGQRVVFERRSAAGDRDVWVMELSRATATRLTFHPADDRQPIWSPDGTRIVFGSNRDGSFGLYSKPANGAGTEEPLLRATGDVAAMSWSSDARFLLYRTVNTHGFNEAWVLPLFGERKTIPFLQSKNFSITGPRLSPNGRWVAYYSLESGALEVYLQSYPTPTGKWQVSTTGGIQPIWSRDGKELFYLGADQKLMVVSVKGDSVPELGTPTPLFDAPVLGGFRTILGFRQQYTVSPDGQRVLVNAPVVEDSNSPITLIQNWTAGLSPRLP